MRRGPVSNRRGPVSLELALPAPAAYLFAVVAIVLVLPVETPGDLVLVGVRVLPRGVEVPLPRLATMFVGGCRSLARGGLLSPSPRSTFLRLGVRAIRPGTRDLRLAADLPSLVPPPCRAACGRPCLPTRNRTASTMTAITTMAMISPVLIPKDSFPLLSSGSGLPGERPPSGYFLPPAGSSSSSARASAPCR